MTQQQLLFEKLCRTLFESYNLFFSPRLTENLPVKRSWENTVDAYRPPVQPEKFSLRTVCMGRNNYMYVL